MKLKAIYRVKELAELAGIPERTMRAWLVHKQVSVLRVDRSVLVPLPAFRDAFPEVWDAIRLERDVSGTAKCPVCSTIVRA